ncbi:IS91 family transposase [Mesorhizobium onobrychidis]|uniref:IS91 family transposase n=1 Tax=Mesorhizobium onobrychidis TaxID=2775404 RepID=A0ABY5QRW9_9HYPH|nr:IS91 family transposase [Mesorhizobium onobrychidis]UVC13920.1 IS91 family transposase [Mesorhizobium onobrychidis]
MHASIEVADIFRAAGPAYRVAHAGQLSLQQFKVMSAIELCRTAALGGHVEACEDCGQRRIAYNSCRNRHCPKCQGSAARTWLAEREADLLPVGYFHVVFTLPAEVAEIAFHNKALVYDLLFKAASETMLTIAADPRHLGARIGITAVLHTWGSAMTHHPHVHMIVPGGGIAPDGSRWISSRQAFLLPVRVLGKLFRRLFLTRLIALHDAGQLAFFGTLARLVERQAFLRHLSPIRNKRWVVYAKAPFAGPEAVLAYLSRYTHRVAISNRRIIRLDESDVTFRYKDYRRPDADRQQVMTLATDEFIRRFLLHVLPRGFHRIRHYGLLASSARKGSLALARELLAAAPPATNDPSAEPDDFRPPCPCCGGRMIVVEMFERWRQPRGPPYARTPGRENAP